MRIINTLEYLNLSLIMYLGPGVFLGIVIRSPVAAFLSAPVKPFVIYFYYIEVQFFLLLQSIFRMKYMLSFRDFLFLPDLI
jgi:hypothetical protein